MTGHRQLHAGPVMRRLLEPAEVSELLGHDRAWFCSNRTYRRLCAAGFPGPVPETGNRWDSAAIDQWLDQQIPEHLRSVEASAAKPAQITDQGSKAEASAPAIDWEAVARAAGQRIAGRRV